MNKSRYTLPNGVTLEGTIEQIRTIAKTLGYTVNFQGYYESSTRGLAKMKQILIMMLLMSFMICL